MSYDGTSPNGALSIPNEDVVPSGRTSTLEGTDAGMDVLEKGIDATTANGTTLTSEKEGLSVPNNEDAIPSARTSEIGVDEADEKGAQPAAEKPPRDIFGVKWVLVVISVEIAAFLFALDNTVVADVQPAIVLAFNDVGKLPWMNGGFFMAAAATNLVWAKAFGQFNTKWTYLVALTMFEVGSAICGAAPNMNAMIVGRVIAGAGGVGTYVGVMTILSVMTTLQERPLYVSTTGILWGAGTILGPVIGGAFTQSNATWRWVSSFRSPNSLFGTVVVS